MSTGKELEVGWAITDPTDNKQVRKKQTLFIVLLNLT